MSRGLAPSLASSLERLAHRLQELDAALADPAVAADNRRYRDLSREHAEVTGVCDLAKRHTQRQADLDGAREMAQDAGDDADMKAMAEEEVLQAEADLLQLETELQTALMPKDPDDARNAFVEIRAGTGGDESALFAGDLARMYTRYAERMGWITEIMSASESDLGGYKEVVLRIEGPNVYGQLKFESGGHRVQRVPATETQGRIHTSAATVAVLPEAEDVDIKIEDKDLRIDVFRSSGSGGQHVVAGPDGIGRGAGDACEGGNVVDADGDDGIHNAGAEHGGPAEGGRRPLGGGPWRLPREEGRDAHVGRHQPAEVALEIALHRLDLRRGRLVVAEHPVFHPLAQGRQHRRRRGEIHVGDPQRDDVAPGVAGPFHRVAAGTLDDGSPYLLMELLDGQSLDQVLRHSGREVRIRRVAGGHQ